MNNVTPSPLEPEADSREKVAAIFREFVGARAVRLDASHYHHDKVPTIAQAIAPSPDNPLSAKDRKAKEIAFHLSDWASDAAFIVALQLFPERFSAAKIVDGIENFLIHAPNHVAAAAMLSGHPIEDIFEVGVQPQMNPSLFKR